MLVMFWPRKAGVIGFTKTVDGVSANGLGFRKGSDPGKPHYDSVFMMV